MARDKCCKGLQKSRHTQIVFGGMAACGSMGQTLKRVSPPPESTLYFLSFLLPSLTIQLLFRLVLHQPLSFLVPYPSCWNTFSLSCLYTDNYNPSENSDCVVESKAILLKHIIKQTHDHLTKSNIVNFA